jgi:hypothetical protein
MVRDLFCTFFRQSILNEAESGREKGRKGRRTGKQKRVKKQSMGLSNLLAGL